MARNPPASDLRGGRPKLREPCAQRKGLSRASRRFFWSRGARVGNVVLAAGLGRMDLLGPLLEEEPLRRYVDPFGRILTERSELLGRAFLQAAKELHVDMARLLLDAGADIDAANKEYGTPLIIALTSGHEDMAWFLLDNGANPNVKDGWGITPLHYALHKGVLVINTFKPSRTDKFGWERSNMPNMVRDRFQRQVERLLDHFEIRARRED